ncbi:MAG: hypothetical protein H7249_20670 [Chitinophagaceae bacterium]|nr:hypothetical protein [Oligoflexus sp.]
MDILNSFTRKSQALNQESLQPIVKKLQNSIYSMLLQETDPRSLSPALVRSACFDLSYLLIRHRQWHHAALLPELAIDFLNSEYHIPGSLSAQMVESALDVLHSYTPRELDWSADDYEEQFLEHLIVCSLISLDEESLAIDLGFGQNVLTLLKNALNVGSDEDVFQFAPELTQQLNKIMERIFAELDESPANMDLYRLKNVLQRDPSTSKNKLNRDYLISLSTMLTACFPDGKSAKDLEAFATSELFGADLRLLSRNGLIYEEPQARRSQGPLFRLSNKGYELTCMQFAFSRWQELGESLHLQDLPSPYQATSLQILAKESSPQLQNLIEKEGQYLSPVALRFVIDHMKRHGGEKSLLEIFLKLLHNQAHAWIRVEICQALPLPNGDCLAGALLDSLLNEDPSPMVRSAARAALQRQRRQSRTNQPQAAGR